MKTAPRPIRINQELASIPPKMFERLMDRYRLAYLMGYSRSRGTRPENT